MKQFNFSGVVGWDVTAGDLRRFLADADGDDVELLISSPGGFIGHALEMFNLVRNYAGKVTAVLSGYAMSAASYIPLAADTIMVEDNAVFMVHNVHGGVFGDHNYILKYGNETAALSRLLAGAYVRHTGKSLEEIQKLMDEETYYYGSEIVEEGFAHELLETDADDDQENFVTAARTAFKECGRTMAKDSQAAADDLSRAMAMFSQSSKFNSTQRAVTPATSTKEQDMDLKTLKKEHPDLVAALSEEFVTGLTQEALQESNPDLVASIMVFGAASEVERIKDVRAQLIPGHEKLIEELEMDGTSSGADAAKAIIVAEKALRAGAAAGVANESNDPVPTANPDDGGKKEMKRSEFDALSIDEQRAFSQDGGTVKD